MSLQNIDRWVRQMRESVAALELPVTIHDTFGLYRDDPVAFVQDVLGAKSATRRCDGRCGTARC